MPSQNAKEKKSIFLDLWSSILCPRIDHLAPFVIKQYLRIDLFSSRIDLLVPNGAEQYLGFDLFFSCVKPLDRIGIQ